MVNRSRTQNEVLFSSESLTLLSLDHLYTFRAALQSYTRTQASCRLEDAVDELRRLILVNGRQKLLKSTLVTSYRWLAPVSDISLEDVCRMYARAYGGVDGEAGVDNDMDATPTEERWAVELPTPEREVTKTQERQRQSPLSFVGTPHPLRGNMSFDRWSADEKEMLEDSWDDQRKEDDVEIDAIEAWYREVQLQPIEIHIEQQPPAEASVVVKPLPPPPPPKPQSPPQLQIRIDSPGANTSNTSPKLTTPPPGRALALRLQTTFDKTSKPKAAPLLQPQPIIRLENQDDEDLTARPLSAIMAAPRQLIPPPPPVHHNLSIRRDMGDDGDQTARPVSAVPVQPPWMKWGPMSIDGIMRGSQAADTRSGLLDPRVGFHHNELSPISPIQHGDGPTTPNGYDDISPITRGEWGFLMATKPKTARVEMC